MATNIITLNRGDTYEFDLTIHDENSENGRYRLTGNDAVYFGVMDPNQPFEDALLRKKYTVEDTDEEGNLFVTLNPEDTIDLLPGLYYYMVKLKMDHIEQYGNGEEFSVNKVITVINKTKFFIYD